MRSALLAGTTVTVIHARTGARLRLRCVLTPRERDMLLAGGLLAQTAARSPA